MSSTTFEVKSTKTGYINNINALKIAECSLKLGSGRMVKEEKIDMGVGIEIKKNIGSYVNIGDTLEIVYVGNKSINYNEINNAFTIELEKKEKEPIIYGIIK